ncbi:hypothetical protein R3P38DRAFT_3257791 [Favolaschia claudopus]|uniref:F-box domain-containing protein n=1 Tax=Favolaschia claudopus TaxID=2862362 RepID=A0AAW0D1M5_9AGAR
MGPPLYLESNPESISESSNAQQCEIAKIPEETLLVIFRHALPPSWTISYARNLPPFPLSAWSADLETKLAIVQVCKIWYRIGLEFLYESVSLHSIGQLPALAATLEAHADIASLVQRLEIGYWVLPDYHSLHNEETRRIFDLCRNLTHLAFNPQCLPQPDSSLPRFPYIQDTPWRITQLDLCDRIDYVSILSALVHLSFTLESLSIVLPARYGIADYHPILTFLHLRSLRLCITMDSVQPGIYWVLPDLQQLLLYPPTFNWRFGAASAFLAQYGQTLRTLSLRCANDNAALEEILGHCPELYHLTVMEAFVADSITLRHEKLQTLDVLGDGTRLRAAHWKTVFPALHSCRYVDPSHGLYPTLPPIEGAARQPDYSLPVSSHLERLFVDGVGDSEEDDCDYEPDSDDDSTSEDEDGTWSEEDLPWSHAAGEEQDEEIGREEALAIFRRLADAGRGS